MKYFATLLMLLFSFSGVAFAAEKATFDIPKELGKVEKVYPSNNPGGPWLIQIQDAHCVIEAQKNIRKLLEYLQQKYGMKHVYLEGGEGQLDTSVLCKFYDPKIKQTVLEKYLEQGKISGAEFAAVMNENASSYYGIENQTLYDRNRKALFEAERTRSKRDQILVSIRQQLEMKLKSKTVRSKDVEEISESLNQVDLLLRASRLDLERKDYQRFLDLYRISSEREPLFFHALGLTQESHDWVDLGILFSPVKRFYDLVIERDSVMSRNILARVQKDHPQIAVLVTGGFHSEGIAKIISESGISTLIVTPQFKSWSGKENYLSALARNLDSVDSASPSKE